jgi:retinol dehydrogenase 12
VFIVTGGYAGVGLELVKILYQKSGKVYIAGRSTQKGSQAIQSIKATFPKSNGQLEFLLLDLADLTTTKRSVDDFLSKESRLDILWNNAGVMIPRAGSKSAQGYELQLGTNSAPTASDHSSLRGSCCPYSGKQPPHRHQILCGCFS